MLTVVAGRPLIDLIKLSYKANQPILLEGAHGIAKSECFEQAARELKVRALATDLSLFEAVDLIGIPIVVDGRTSYASPDFLPRDGCGLLLFEELNRAQVSVRTPCLQLLTTRTLHSYQLPPGWLPCASINPAGADYQVDDLDGALRSRFLQVTVKPGVSEWLAEFARQNAIHSKIIDFVARSPEAFEHRDCNPRAWTYASRFLCTWESNGRDPDLLAIGLAGLLEDRWAAAFLRFLNEEERPLAAAEIVTEYPMYRSALLAWRRAKRLDLIEASVRNLRRYLQPQRVYDAVVADAAQTKNTRDFVADLPAEVRRTLNDWLAERRFEELRVS